MLAQHVKKIAPYYLVPEIKLLDKYERWRRVARILKVSKEARQRLEWVIYSYDHSPAETSRYFGMAPKTFYKWFNQFDEDNLYSLYKLENKSRAPKHVRQREITPLEETRIIGLRKRNIRYGKEKIARIYRNEFGENISAWKVQYTIKKYRLYYNHAKADKISKRRAKTKKMGRKKKTIELINNLPGYKKKAGYIICLDTITIYRLKLKRYVFTAIDKYGKFAYARAYQSKTAKNGEDFLYRLNYLMDGQIPKVGHDNGTEFKGYFRQACSKLGIKQYYSRVRTPKDNPDCERFNQTLETEFLDMGKFNPDVKQFNRSLTEWLIEYNFRRPHFSLNYQTPLQYSKVLPMYSSCTKTLFFSLSVLN